MIRRIDAWIGAKLFHPPIIWVCRLAGMTQFAIHRYLWWAAVLVMVYLDDHRSYFMSIFLGLFALTRTIGAALNPDGQLRENLPMRLLIWFVLAMTAFGPDTKDDRRTLPANIAILIAEYALTIRTIPPRQARKPRRIPAARSVA